MKQNTYYFVMVYIFDHDNLDEENAATLYTRDGSQFVINRYTALQALDVMDGQEMALEDFIEDARKDHAELYYGDKIVFLDYQEITRIETNDAPKAEETTSNETAPEYATTSEAYNILKNDKRASVRLLCALKVMHDKGVELSLLNFLKQRNTGKKSASELEALLTIYGKKLRV